MSTNACSFPCSGFAHLLFHKRRMCAFDSWGGGPIMCTPSRELSSDFSTPLILQRKIIFHGAGGGHCQAGLPAGDIHATAKADRKQGVQHGRQARQRYPEMGGGARQCCQGC